MDIKIIVVNDPIEIGNELRIEVFYINETFVLTCSQISFQKIFQISNNSTSKNLLKNEVLNYIYDSNFEHNKSIKEIIEQIINIYDF